MGLENEALRTKLTKLTDVGENKILELQEQLEHTLRELAETRIHYKQYFYTMDHERERILDETQQEFESEARVLQL